MRTAAQETAPQVALRGCSKEGGGEKSRCMYDLVKGEFMQQIFIFAKVFC